MNRLTLDPRTTLEITLSRVSLVCSPFTLGALYIWAQGSRVARARSAEHHQSGQQIIWSAQPAPTPRTCAGAMHARAGDEGIFSNGDGLGEPRGAIFGRFSSVLPAPSAAPAWLPRRPARQLLALTPAHRPVPVDGSPVG